MSQVIVEGVVAPGYERVREVFEENFLRRNEVGAACAAYVGGEKVVDLWGGVADPKTGRPWREDTMAIVFSTTKGVSSMALAHAHAHGLFAYDDLVAKHWPDFAAAGKERMTIRTLLSHQGGLAAIDRRIDLATLADPDRLAVALAAQAPNWVPGEHHGYHGLTLGFLEGELIRRVDPKKRTIGRYFADEIARPLGLDFHIGLGPEVDRTRIARMLGDHFALRMVFNLNKLPAAFVLGFLNPRSITHRAFSNPAVLGQPHRYNDEELRRLELPASNGIGTARSVARAYGELATGGHALGFDRATLEALELPAAPPARGTYDLVLRAETSFSLGYSKPTAGFQFGTDGRAYGTPGAGGSFGYADPALGLGFAYVMNRMDFYLFKDPREAALSKAVEASARARS